MKAIIRVSSQHHTTTIPEILMSMSSLEKEMNKFQPWGQRPPGVMEQWRYLSKLYTKFFDVRKNPGCWEALDNSKKKG